MLLLPEKVDTTRPEHIMLHPATLQRGDLYRHRGTWRVIAYVRTFRDPVSHVPQHLYLMECVHGGERGQKRLTQLSDMQNVKVNGGVRYLYAMRRPHPKMIWHAFDLYVKEWRKEAA